MDRKGEFMAEEITELMRFRKDTPLGIIKDLLEETEIGEIFEKIIEMPPAYDRGEDGGVHGLELRMILKGDKGAVQFVLYTNWFLELANREARGFNNQIMPPIPADLGFHSKKPMYEGQEVMDLECEYTNGLCYYDGSGLAADAVFAILLKEGSDGVWKYLHRYYQSIFNKESE